MAYIAAKVKFSQYDVSYCLFIAETVEQMHAAFAKHLVSGNIANDTALDVQLIFNDGSTESVETAIRFAHLVDFEITAASNSSKLVGLSDGHRMLLEKFKVQLQDALSSYDEYLENMTSGIF